MSKNLRPSFEILNLKHLSRVAKIDYIRLHNCISGRYYSLTTQEETRLYNAIRDEVEKSTLAIGFTYDGKKVKAKD